MIFIVLLGVALTQPPAAWMPGLRVETGELEEGMGEWSSTSITGLPPPGGPMGAGEPMELQGFRSGVELGGVFRSQNCLTLQAFLAFGSICGTSNLFHRVQNSEPL